MMIIIVGDNITTLFIAILIIIVELNELVDDTWKMLDIIFIIIVIIIFVIIIVPILH